MTTEKDCIGVDMHVHTNYSDSFTKVTDIIKLARRENIGVAITDHNSPYGAINAFKQRGDALIIPGMEVGCIEGPHILMYFYNPKELEEFYKKNIEKKKNPNPYMLCRIKTSELIEKSKGYNCILSAAHPYTPTVGILRCIGKGSVTEELVDKMKFMEVISGESMRSFNKKTIDYVKENNKFATGGSDAHLLKEVGGVRTFCRSHNVESFLNSVKKGKSYVMGKESNLLYKIPSWGGVILKHSRYTPFVFMEAFRRLEAMRTNIIDSDT